FYAGFEYIHIAVEGKLSFREYTNRLAISERQGNFLKGLFIHIGILLFRGNENNAPLPENIVQYRDFKERAVHDKTNVSLYRSRDEKRIDKSNMVTYKKNSSFFRNDVQIVSLHPVHDL